MKRVPANRYAVFFLLALAGLAWDLYSKSTVFADLGYRDPADHRVVLETGDHRLFARPPGAEGESRAYLDGWTTFRLLTSFNTGALWGIGQDKTWLFALLSVAAAAGILYWLFGHGAAQSRWLTVALAFVMAGTLGNLWDRLGWHGYMDSQGETIHAVRDFLYFTFGNFHWPVFNFADVFLVTGAIMLVLQSMLPQGEDEKRGVGGRPREEGKPADCRVGG